jgi:hypothetical protein
LGGFFFGALFADFFVKVRPLSVARDNGVMAYCVSEYMSIYCRCPMRNYS